MSNEIVPLDYNRQAYNTIHGVETRHHNDRLTDEQAELINENFDVYVVPIRHGYGLKDDPQALEKGTAPGSGDYRYFKRTIDELMSDDVVFVEAVGYNEEDEAERHLLSKEAATAIHNIYRGDGNPSINDFKEQAKALDKLAESKDEFLIDGMEYIMRYALLTGHRVVVADADSFSMRRTKAMLGEVGRSAMGMPIDQDQQAIFNAARETNAVNTIKDFALGSLSSDEEAGGQKRKLVLFFGASHAAALGAGFNNLGIKADVLPYLASSPERRKAEHAEKASQRAAARVST